MVDDVMAVTRFHDDHNKEKNNKISALINGELIAVLLCVLALARCIRDTV
jgi:hypothetical protein